MNKDQKLAVLDMSEDEQWNFLVDERIMTRCASTIGADHRDIRKRYLADLAFRKNNGTIAGKIPIEHIIDALIKNLDR